MLIFLIVNVSATPTFIVRKGADELMIEQVMREIDFKGYDKIIEFTNQEHPTLAGKFRYEYYTRKNNIQIIDYKIEIYQPAYRNSGTLKCTLKHEIAHFKNMKINPYNITEEYAEKYGCKTYDDV